MSTSAIETLVEVSNSTLDERAVTLQDQIIPGEPAEVLGQQHRKHEIGYDTSLEQLTKKKHYRESLDGKGAALSHHMSSVPAPPEKPIDIPSLLSKLSFLLPQDPQLERRARKLAGQLAKGRRATCGWDLVFFSELTPTESRMPDDEFVALYSDRVQTQSKKGGRPRKYRTATAQRKGHTERQRRYRERKLLVSSDVTKTPSQLADR
jgi:hypothetical protein